MPPAPRESLHHKLRERMLTIIQDAAVNDSLPPERELAKHFGVSRGTMEKVMRELQLEGWVSRQVGRGTFVAGRDQIAIPRNGMGQSGGSIVLASPDFFSHFLWSLNHAADAACHRHGLDLYRLTLQPLTDYAALFALLESRPELRGVVLMPAGSELPRSLLRRLDSYGKPIVILARLPEHGFRHISHVCTDDFMVGYLKADCLLRQGHRDIGCVRNEPDTLAMAAQQDGVRSAFADHGVPIRHLASSSHDVHHWEYTGQAAVEMTQDLLRQHPQLTGLITDSMPGGFAALRGVHLAGRRCPDDVSVVTSMAHAGFEALTVPALTSVVCSADAQMATAIDIVMDPSRVHERSISIAAELVERESVQPTADAARSLPVDPHSLCQATQPHSQD